MTRRIPLGARALILTILLLSLALVVACGQSAPATTAPGRGHHWAGRGPKDRLGGTDRRSGTHAHPVY